MRGKVLAWVLLTGLVTGGCGRAEPPDDLFARPAPDAWPQPEPPPPDPGAVPEPTPDEPTPSPEVPDEPAPSEPPAPGPEPVPAPAPEPPAQPDPTRPPPAEGLPASLLGAEWSRIPTQARVVALTFDAGANADALPSILATLDATDTPATFFLTGRWVEAHPGHARTVATRYPIGNHTMTHPELTGLSDAAVRDEVEDAEAAIEDVAGTSPLPLFRFPFGDRDERTIGLVNAAGYGSFRWTVDTLGWKGTSGGMTTDLVVARVLDAAQPGAIVLCHVGSHPTDGSMLDADALPRIIDGLAARGYRFVTLPEAIALVP